MSGDVASRQFFRRVLFFAAGFVEEAGDVLLADHVHRSVLRDEREDEPFFDEGCLIPICVTGRTSGGWYCAAR